MYTDKKTNLILLVAIMVAVCVCVGTMVSCSKDGKDVGSINMDEVIVIANPEVDDFQQDAECVKLFAYIDKTDVDKDGKQLVRVEALAPEGFILGGQVQCWTREGDELEYIVDVDFFDEDSDISVYEEFNAGDDGSITLNVNTISPSGEEYEKLASMYLHNSSEL